MCWPWMVIRHKIQIAMVAGRICQVVVDEGTIIQRRQSISWKTVIKSG